VDQSESNLQSDRTNKQLFLLGCRVTGNLARFNSSVAITKPFMDNSYCSFHVCSPECFPVGHKY